MGSIKELVQRCVQTEMPGLDIGIVTCEQPLRVTLEDDAKVNISESSLVIPSGKKPLKEGEELYLLSMNRGKIYYVLDRA